MRKNGRTKDDGSKARRGNGTGSLWRQKTDGKLVGSYFAVFSVPTADGKTKRKFTSLHTTDLDEARVLLAELAAKYGFTGERADFTAALDRVKDEEAAERERLAKAEAERRAAEEAERRAAEEAAAAAERDRNAVTLAEAFDRYEESTKRPQSGEVTLNGYRSQYGFFLAWMKEHHPTITRLREVTPEHAEAFIKHLTATRSHNTRNKYLIFLRTFWRTMRWNEDSQLSADPWEGIRTLTTAEDEVIHKELTFDQLAAIGATFKAEAVPGRKILDVFKFGLEDIRDELRVLFALGIYTGLRLGDCATLSWEAVDHVRRTITATPRKTARKYKRLVILPVHPALAAILDEYAATHSRRAGYILPTLADIYLNRESSMLTNRVQAIFRAAGITTTADGENGTRTRTVVGFHSLRHTFTSIMLNQGADSMLVEKMLGHSSDSMTARYFHQHAAALASAISTLPSLPTFAARSDLLADAPRTPLVAAATEPKPTTPTSATAAPYAGLDALREALAQMTNGDLTAAAEIIRAEIEHRRAK